MQLLENNPRQGGNRNSALYIFLLHVSVLRKASVFLRWKKKNKTLNCFKIAGI